jgi:hypothetical protein
MAGTGLGHVADAEVRISNLRQRRHVAKKTLLFRLAGLGRCSKVASDAEQCILVR